MPWRSSRSASPASARTGTPTHTGPMRPWIASPRAERLAPRGSMSDSEVISTIRKVLQVRRAVRPRPWRLSPVAIAPRPRAASAARYALGLVERRLGDDVYRGRARERRGRCRRRRCTRPIGTRSGFSRTSLRAFSLRPDVYAARGAPASTGPSRPHMDPRRDRAGRHHSPAARRLRSSYCALAHGRVLVRQLPRRRHPDAA